jgi:hypothetical protein
MKCPNLKDKDVREEFNSIIKRLGGIPLQDKDIEDRQGYRKRMNEKQSDAYYQAYHLWDKHQSGPKVLKFLDDEQALKKKAMAPEIKTYTGPMPSERKIRDIEDLTRAIPTIPATDIPPSVKARTVAMYEQKKQTVEGALNAAKATIINNAKAYAYAPVYTTWDNAIRDHIGALQESAMKAHDFAQTILDRIPDKSRREALVNYIQASGDEGVLKDRFDQLNAKKSPWAQGYKNAIDLLGPEEKKYGRQVAEYFDSMLQKGIDAGVIEAGVENYVNQIWDRSKKATTGKRLYAEALSGILTKEPSFAKKRIYDSYFEGELKDEIPKNKDIGFLISVYDRSFNQAIATRGFIGRLASGKAQDGKPLGVKIGHASPLTGAYTGDEVVLPPQISEADWKAGLYSKPPDHPAFRNWQYETEDGMPINIRGDMWLHQEAADLARKLFAPSAIRKTAFGRGLLKVNAELKATLLSLSIFHQENVAERAAFVGVNPYGVPEINLKDPMDRALIHSGLMIFDYNGQHLFSEGVSGGGLVKYVPYFGKWQAEYTDFLFRDYIPRLKMATAKAYFEKNMKDQAGRMSRDDVLKMTADQANAAFGELPWEVLGYSKTTVDSMRLGLLAPDFLLSNLTNYGQATKLYGRGIKGLNNPQMAAIVRAAAIMGVGAAVINMILNNGDPHLERPFNVYYKGNYYTIRSHPGDIVHAVTDFRSFVYNRLQPSIIKPLIEFLTGRDAQGHIVSAFDEVKDFLMSPVPIPGQKVIAKAINKPEDLDWWGGLLQSLGIGVSVQRPGRGGTVGRARAGRSGRGR